MTEEKDTTQEEQMAPEAGVSETQEESIEALKTELAEERAKSAQYLANWQRAQADFINYKRRAEQEKQDAAKFSNAMLILNLLPILDDLERALGSVSTKLAGFTWVDGIHLIYRKLQKTLEMHGLTEIRALGEGFDPNLHEAVMYDEGEEGKVVEELQKGYKLHDRVIRPTMVKVGRRPESAGEEQPK